MRVWLITIGEPLPTDGEGDRLLRTGLLADRLQRAGHEVVWWSSGFDHIRKQHRTPRTGQILIESGYTLRLLKSSGYRRNISLRRLLDHRQLARHFRDEALSSEMPDVILCSWPTLDLCDEAVRYGKAHGIPVVLDVRDMWPDALIDVLPSLVRPLSRICAWPLYRMARRACRDATAMTAITEGCLEWVRRLAGAPRGATDRAFPLAYRDRSPKEHEREAAVAFWRDHGVAPDGKLTACFFGTLGRQFELGTVLNAARRLNELRVPVRFVLCGAGPELESCQRRAAELPNVVVPGWVNAAQIWTLMRLSSVGLAPYRSTWDFQMSIPNKPIEYLSAGLPVISSLQGTLAQLLDQNGAGLTYRNESSEELADILQRLHAEPDSLVGMSRQARSLFERQFVADAVYDSMIDYLLGFTKAQRPQAAA